MRELKLHLTFTVGNGSPFDKDRKVSTHSVTFTPSARAFRKAAENYFKIVLAAHFRHGIGEYGKINVFGETIEYKEQIY